jgi:hypothetical protein
MADNFPFHEEFQKLVLAYLTRVKGALATYQDEVSSAHFDSTTNGTLYAYHADYFKKHSKSPSREVVLDLINQGFVEETDDNVRKRAACQQRLDEIIDIDISDSEYIDTRVREFLRWCSMKEFVYDAFSGLEKNTFDPDLPKKARVALAKGEKAFSTGLEWRDSVYARIHDDVNASESSRVPTGITHFDQEIGGGLKGGELGIILAVPKGFKSGTMLNFAYGAMQQQLYRGVAPEKGSNVAYFTLELSERLVASRFDRRCSLMPRDAMVKDPDGYANRLEMMQNTVLANSKLFIKGYKSKQATCDTFRAYLDRMYDEEDITFCEIIVDYLDLVKASGGSGKKEGWEDAAIICEDLRDVAIEYDLPIWTACRATRDAVGKPYLSMNHMSKSFERIGVADLVVAGCQTEEEKAKGELRLAMVAARNDAGDKQVNCKVDYALMKLVSSGVSQIQFEDDMKKVRNKRGDDKMLSKVKALKAAQEDDEDG